jgi:hypothetical protein
VGSSSGIPVPAGCVADASLACDPSAVGISCPAGDDPSTTGLLCSAPTPNPDGTDGYCCEPFSSPPSCQPDSTVVGCQYPAYGFACAAGGGSPDQEDPALVCSAPVVDPSSGVDLYCCTDNGSGSSSGSSSGSGGGCTVDSSLACDAGTDGVDCYAGGNPEADFPGYICSTPSPQADGTDGYCCATGFSGSTCAQDLSVQGCVYPSIPFSCAGTDAPDQSDPSLNCSSGVADPNTGDTLYCCQ